MPAGTRGQISILGLLICLGTAITAALYVFLRPRRRRGGVELNEERASLWSWPLVWKQLCSMFTALARYLSQRVEERSADPAANISSSGLELPEIRRIYRQMLRLGADCGKPRHRAKTPRGYAHELISIARFDSASIVDLTRAYRNSRYGEIAPDEAALSRARSAFIRLSQEDKEGVTNGQFARQPWTIPPLPTLPPTSRQQIAEKPKR